MGRNPEKKVQLISPLVKNSHNQHSVNVRDRRFPTLFKDQSLYSSQQCYYYPHPFTDEETETLGKFMNNPGCELR